MSLYQNRKKDKLQTGTGPLECSRQLNRDLSQHSYLPCAASPLGLTSVSIIYRSLLEWIAEPFLVVVLFFFGNVQSFSATQDWTEYVIC